MSGCDGVTITRRKLFTEHGIPSTYIHDFCTGAVRMGGYHYIHDDWEGYIERDDICWLAARLNHLSLSLTAHIREPQIDERIRGKRTLIYLLPS